MKKAHLEWAFFLGSGAGRLDGVRDPRLVNPAIGESALTPTRYAAAAGYLT
jgi:hypothetical protein